MASSNRISESGDAIAIVPCDRVELVNGRWSIVGTLDTFRAPFLPFKLERFSVYVALAKGGTDQTLFHLNFLAPDGRELSATEARIRRWGDTGAVEFGFDMLDSVFTVPGEHVLRLTSADGRLISERPIYVVLNDEQQAGRSKSQPRSP
jgi:hypothetical protein